MVDVGAVLRAERLALVDYLETLDEEQWAAPSLCTEWTVQETAAHLAWAPATKLGYVIELPLGAFRFNRVNARLAKKWATRGTDAILGQLRVNADRGARPPGMPWQAVLSDAVVHSLDIRRPLGSPRPVPIDAFGVVAGFQMAAPWPLNVTVGGSARKRLEGVRLTTQDSEWTYGAGPEVRASKETVLLVLFGRMVDRTELDGPGADTLHARL